MIFHKNRIHILFNTPLRDNSIGVILGKQHGVAAVEMALILPLLCFIVFAIINFGIIFYDNAVITNAAREGARWASINTYKGTASTSCDQTNTTNPSNPCAVTAAYAKDRLITLVGGENPSPTITFQYASTDFLAGDLQTVNISYDFTGVGYYILYKYLNSSNVITLSSTAKMYHE